MTSKKGGVEMVEKVFRTHRIALSPTEKQKVIFAKLVEAERVLYKRRGKRESFKLSRGSFKILGRRIIIKGIIGEVKCFENLRYDYKSVLNIIVSREAKRWYASVTCIVDCQAKVANGTLAGIDLGVKEFVLFDRVRAVRYQVPMAYKHEEKGIRHLRKALSRKKVDSRSWRKTEMRLSARYSHIKNVRKEWLHRITSEIAAKYETIVIEDLDVIEMINKSSYSLANSIRNACFRKFRIILEYKAKDRVILADRMFPSSKICSSCSTKIKSLPLYVREWKCPHCGAEHDRDLNAAINLWTLGLHTAQFKTKPA
jgi:putative transposase